jgi:hypothetical protein
MQKAFRSLVDNSYTDKVSKEFPQLHFGYDAATKKIGLVGNVTQPPG